MTENELTIDALVTIVRGQLNGAAFQVNLVPGLKCAYGKDDSPFFACRPGEADQAAGHLARLSPLTKKNVWIFVVPESEAEVNLP